MKVGSDQTESLAEIGLRIRKSRKAKGWSQEALAHEAGVDRSYVGGVERGERNITFTMLCLIAEALEEDLGELTKNLPLKK